MNELTMNEVEEVSGGRRPNGPVNGHAGGGFKISRTAVVIAVVVSSLAPPITIGRTIIAGIAGLLAW